MQQVHRKQGRDVHFGQVGTAVQATGHVPGVNRTGERNAEDRKKPWVIGTVWSLVYKQEEKRPKKDCFELASLGQVWPSC